MLPALMTGVLMVTAVVQIDTVVPARPGMRLDVNSHGGEVVIRTWSRSEVRISADLEGRERLEVLSVGSVLKVRARNNYGFPQSVDWRLTIPTTMDIEIGGVNLDVEAFDVGGTVKISTVQGDINLRGGSRLVTVYSVSGDVQVSNVRGQVRAESTNGDAYVADVEGEVSAESVNGDVLLRGIRSDFVEATTVNGDVVYDGTLRDDGRYRFNTHNGDLAIRVPAGTNATISVSTFHGEFQSDFPVTLTETIKAGQRFSFTIGNGSARIELGSFGGEIRLVRR